MSLKTRGILVLVIGTILGVSLSVGGILLDERKRPSNRQLTLEQARLITEVMNRIKSDYVEPLDETELLENALRGMVADLDRHSAYLDASEFQDIRITASGKYSGVGLEVSVLDDRVVVVSPIDGTPAARAGVESGDEILKIDNRLVTEEGVDETVELLRGRPGTPVTIEVQRAGYDDPLSFDLTRQRIEVASTRYEVLNESIGYLRVSQFIDSTTKDAIAAIDNMQEIVEDATGGSLTGLILDLRNNPGGILDAAVDISDLFLDEGVIVSAEGRAAESQFRREATSGDVLNGAAIAVLVNGGSASASEIVAGALQDHNRATVVGTRTFGKGLVQTVMPLSRGRAIKLTTSRYYTPSGDSINEVGVAPDLYIEGTRSHPGRDINGSLDRENDVQLIEAIELILNQPVMHSRAPD
jgi:carboxyl-terminal processing protease